MEHNSCLQGVRCSARERLVMIFSCRCDLRRLRIDGHRRFGVKIAPKRVIFCSCPAVQRKTPNRTGTGPLHWVFAMRFDSSSRLAYASSSCLPSTVTRQAGCGASAVFAPIRRIVAITLKAENPLYINMSRGSLPSLHDRVGGKSPVLCNGRTWGRIPIPTT